MHATNFDKFKKVSFFPNSFEYSLKCLNMVQTISVEKVYTFNLTSGWSHVNTFETRQLPHPFCVYYILVPLLKHLIRDYI